MSNLNWGLRPVLFYIGKLPVEAYPVFLTLALIVGILVYLLELKNENCKNPDALYIVFFALLGGTIGSKLPIFFIYWKEINAHPDSLATLLSGRTIIGGLIGGLIGNKLAKKLFNIKVRMGNQIGIPVAIAMAIGRIGCLLRGCCYGKPTSLIWGVDFGDHILRHPTQAYEIIFDLLLALYLYWRKKRGVEPGELFRIFLSFYLSFRFLIEFIRVERVSFIGLTDFQLLCVVALLFINRRTIKQILNIKDGKKHE